jgi:hypothetical protein
MRKSTEPIDTRSPMITRRKSNDSIITRRRSNDSISTPMVIDVDDPQDFVRDGANLPPSNESVQQLNSYVSAKDFNYSMSLIDEKINALYKLCRFIGDQQQENVKMLKKLVALDELTDNFWNVSYLENFNFNIIKVN